MSEQVDIIARNIAHAERTIPRLEALRNKYGAENNAGGVSMAESRIRAYRLKLETMKRSGQLLTCYNSPHVLPTRP